MDKLIGITIGLKSEDESLWVNGIKMNAAMLYMALNKIPGYDVKIIDTSGNVKDHSKIKFWKYSDIPIVPITSIIKDIDVLIMLGTTYDVNGISKLHKIGMKKKCKIIDYKCGNNYVIDMERIIFGEEDSGITPSWYSRPDQVWYVPQQQKHNHDYYSIPLRTDSVFPVPFVWDSMFLDLQNSTLVSPKAEYKDTGESKRIVSFEPNFNVVKFSVPIIMACEDLVQRGIEFKDLTICSGKKMFSNKGFRNALDTLEILKQGKIKWMGRYPIVAALAGNTDVIVSHQWDNPLNYAYLDALYFNYPLIHNAEMIQDGGYYYEGFKMKEASKQIEWAIKNHDNNLEEYKERNSKILHRYTKENEELIETYKKLLDNLFKPNSHKLSYNYNWKTNTYFNEG